MALIAKAKLKKQAYPLKIAVELAARVEKVKAEADTKGLVFDLDSTLEKMIEREVKEAEKALAGFPNAGGDRSA